jgi:hypothetical protein
MEEFIKAIYKIVHKLELINETPLGVTFGLAERIFVVCCLEAAERWFDTNLGVFCACI